MAAKAPSFQYSLVLCEIFGARKLAAKVELSSSSVERYVDWVVKGKTSQSRKMVEVLEAKMKRLKKKSFTSTFVITGLLLLREPGTIKVCQILQTSTAVHMYAAGQVRVSECFFWLFWIKVVADPFERKQVSAEPPDEEQGVGKDGSSEVCFDHDEIALSGFRKTNADVHVMK